MKNLVVVRHAKSTWKYSGIRDHDRPLNERGINNANILAASMANDSLKIEKIYCSSSSRTVSTAIIFADHLAVPFKQVEIRSELYEAFFSELIDFIKNIDNEYKSVMLVIHNPLITTFAHRIASIHTDNVPTSGLISIRLKIDHWTDFSEEVDTELLEYVTPKKLQNN